MPSVRVKENEPFDVALRRFKRACEKAGTVAEARAVKLTKSQPLHVNAQQQRR